MAGAGPFLVSLAEDILGLEATELSLGGTESFPLHSTDVLYKRLVDLRYPDLVAPSPSKLDTAAKSAGELLILTRIFREEFLYKNVPGGPNSGGGGECVDGGENIVFSRLRGGDDGVKLPVGEVRRRCPAVLWPLDFLVTLLYNWRERFFSPSEVNMRSG